MNPQSRGWLLPALLLVTALSAACRSGEQHPPAPPAAEAGAPAAEQAVDFDRWLGNWTGPEGTALLLERDGAAYAVTIRSLDGPVRYAAQVVGDQLQFERDGQREQILASNGEQTGMKWLVDKHDCLTVKPGEGYCRD